MPENLGQILFSSIFDSFWLIFKETWWFWLILFVLWLIVTIFPELKDKILKTSLSGIEKKR